MSNERTTPDPSQAFYYNLETGQVEQGYVSDWTDRMGPYATHAEAADALGRAAARNEAWEAQDRAWNDDETED
ncbi:MAG: methionine aminopeptidase [Actinomycetales bacterium]|nr:methionine aminopeptidase [Actinomycetales bacterium]